MQNIVIFDCETGPLPLSEIQHLKPEFTPPANYKDPVKIAASIAEQEQRWLADGALSALTGRVLCVGLLYGEVTTFLNDEDEEAIMAQTWIELKDAIRSGRNVVGFCCKTFDLPFLVRRSWAHKLTIPQDLIQGRYFNPSIVDVAERWACGGREPRDRISLDHLSKFLGTGEKLGEGKDFAALWQSDRDKALEYLKRDLELTKAAYERLYL